MERYGASGPIKGVYSKFGFTQENIAAQAKGFDMEIQMALKAMAPPSTLRRSRSSSPSAPSRPSSSRQYWSLAKARWQPAPARRRPR